MAHQSPDTFRPARPGGAADPSGFAAETEPFRRELLALCLRHVRSPHEAEDLVQETYLRAWRSYGAFEGRSAVRTWLHRIATNACLSALRERRPTPLDPAGLDDRVGLSRAGASGSVLCSDSSGSRAYGPEHDDPAETVASLEQIRLALLAGLRHLPPRQRAVLLLRDVLALSASDVGQMLGMSTPAVKSALQRARTRLEEVAPVPGRAAEPRDPVLRLLLRRYAAAFAQAGPHTIADVAVQDVRMEWV